MTDPRNVAHDKRVKREKKHHGLSSGRGGETTIHRLGMKPHQNPLPSGHGPDADESIDSVESGEQH
jgi:hypothetical protein